MKLQDGNKRVDNPETSNTLRDASFIKTTKEEEAFIKRLMTMNFKHHVIKYVIDIVTLRGKKMIELEKGNRKFQKKINGKYLMLFH